MKAKSGTVDLNLAKELVKETLEFFGCGEIFDKVSIEENCRITKRAGDAMFDHVNKRGRIRLSAKFWTIAPHKSCVELVHHEAAHIVNEYLRGTKPYTYMLRDSDYSRTEGHGIYWQNFMKELGYKKPARCHTFGEEIIKYFNNYYIYKCHGCDIEIMTTMNMGNMYHRKPHTYGRCKVCKTLVNYKNFTLKKGIFDEEMV